MQRSSLYSEHFGFVWSSLRRFGVAATDLEDATHDAFVVVYRRRDELARADSPRSWLFGVARRVASNHRRRIRRAERRLTAVRDVGPRSTQPERDLERADASRIVGRFLDGLSEHQRDVFVLSELHQMTAKEVGELLEINPNTASARLRAARKAFARFAEDVRKENDWDGASALVQLQRPARPSPDARRRVGAALAVSLGQPLSGSGPEPGAGSSSSGGAGLNLVGGLKAAGVALALAGGSLGIIAAGAAAVRPSPAPTVTSTERSSHVSPSTEPHTEPSAGESSPRPAPEVVADSEPNSTPRPASSELAAGSSASPTTRGRGLARSPDPAANSETPTPSPSPTSSTDLPAQTQLLSSARTALAQGDTDEVARRVDEYRRRFGAGPFLPELEVIEIRGRCASGNTAAAEALGERFLKAHPGSAHLAVIEQTCAGSITKSDGSGH